MKAILILFFILPCTLFSTETGDVCILLSIHDKVDIREPYQKEWKTASNISILKDLMTVKSGSNSYAKIKTYDGSIFLLPPDAQIEIRELKKITRDELVSELTALDLQKLPAKKKSTNTHNAFVLHGFLKDSADAGSLKKYIKFEEKGALSLFEQGYISGFVIKSNRLKYAFPKYSSKKLETALIKAYKIMEMPARMNELIQLLK
jgi:hypothetical protein